MVRLARSRLLHTGSQQRSLRQRKAVCSDIRTHNFLARIPPTSVDDKGKQI